MENILSQLDRATYVLTSMGYLTSAFSSTDGGKISRTRALKPVPAIGTSMNNTRGRVTGANNSLSLAFVSQSRTLAPPAFRSTTEQQQQNTNVLFSAPDTVSGGRRENTFSRNRVRDESFTGGYKSDRTPIENHETDGAVYLPKNSFLFPRDSRIGRFYRQQMSEVRVFSSPLDNTVTEFRYRSSNYYAPTERGHVFRNVRFRTRGFFVAIYYYSYNRTTEFVNVVSNTSHLRNYSRTIHEGVALSPSKR